MDGVFLGFEAALLLRSRALLGHCPAPLGLPWRMVQMRESVKTLQTIERWKMYREPVWLETITRR